jgi:hypothetical protein
MQIKTTLRFLLTLVRIATIKNTNNNKYWQGCWKKNPHILLVGMKAGTTTMESSMEAPYKSKNRPAVQSSNTTPRDKTEGL